MNREQIEKEIRKFIKHSKKNPMPIYIDDLIDWHIAEIEKAKARAYLDGQLDIKNKVYEAMQTTQEIKVKEGISDG